MSRLADLPPAKFNDAQQRLYEGLLEGKRATRPGDDFLGPRGGLRGPFNAMVHAPAVGEPAHRLGEALRYGGDLPGTWRELAILTVAQAWQAQYEWWAHARIGRTEGLADSVIDAVKAGRRPPDDAGPELQIIHDYATTLMTEHRVDDALYGRAAETLGESRLVELTLLMGYYTMISMTLNVFQVPMPEGEAPPFPEADA